MEVSIPASPKPEHCFGFSLPKHLTLASENTQLTTKGDKKKKNPPKVLQPEPIAIFGHFFFFFWPDIFGHFTLNSLFKLVTIYMCAALPVVCY